MDNQHVAKLLAETADLMEIAGEDAFRIRSYRNAASTIEAYAYFRVGYHRGLDTLRANGWRGSGYVRWVHPSNRGFLSSLNGLAKAAAAIGELDEAERCELFLRQCDPSWPPADLQS